MTATRTLFSGMTRLELHTGISSKWNLEPELVVHRPFRRSVHLPLDEIWLVKLDENPIRLRVFVGDRAYTWRLKRYGNPLPLLDFVESLRNLSKERSA